MKIVETILWVCGALLVALFFSANLWGESARQRGVAQFVEQKQQALTTQSAAQQPSIADTLLASSAIPNLAVIESELATHNDAPSSAATVFQGQTIAVLRIPRIALEVPIADGTTERVLLSGAGLVKGTATPGSNGNIGIAAHRDTYFRGLKDVVVGDLIELETLAGIDTYRVSTLSVVEPSDVYVLDETPEPALTLVTCYPFYFVGSAPQRYIVRAVAAKFHSLTPRKKL